MHACREQLQAVAALLLEFIQKDSETAIKLILPQLTEASKMLLGSEEELTIEHFIKGVTTLARLVGMCFGPQKGPKCAKLT
jgi:hypothetical protein